MTMRRNASPSVSSDRATITERYDALVAGGAIERDPAQEKVVAMLDALARRLHDIKQTRFGLTRFLELGDSSDEKQRGIYIFGGVGRGKTILMDLTSSWRMCTTPSESSREHGRWPYERW
jgi:predicted ATPase